MIAARIVSYIVEYTAPAWHRRHVDSRPRRAIHPPISPYHGHPRSIPFVRPLNGQAEPPPWCSIIDTYPSCRLAFPWLHVPDAFRPSILCLCILPASHQLVSWSRVNWKIFSSMDRKVYTNFVRGKFQSVKSMIFLLMKLYSLFLFDTKKCIIDVDVVLIRASKKKEKRRKRKAINLLVERWTSFQSTSFQVLQNEEGKGWEPLLVAMASINRLTG